MIRERIGIFLVVFLLMAPVIEAGDSPYGLELVVEEPSLMPFGVLVGELVFSNQGTEPFRFGGVLGIHSGYMYYELKDSEGQISRIQFLSSADRVSFQHATLAPGDSFVHPVCLLKIRGKYIFDKPGKYSIRAFYHGPPPIIEAIPPGKQDPNEPKPKPRYLGFRAKSNWVEIQVLDHAGRIDLYKNSHDCPSVFKAFDCPQSAEKIEHQLGGYPGYNREQEKFVAYQKVGGRLLRALLINQEPNPSIQAEAEAALAFSREHQVGEKMWEYIVDRLSSFPLEGERREKWNARNGYYF